MKLELFNNVTVLTMHPDEARKLMNETRKQIRKEKTYIEVNLKTDQILIVDRRVKNDK